MYKDKDTDLEELARIKKNEYQRKWREKNKNKVKEYNQRYWQNKVIREEKQHKQNKGE